MRRWWSRLGVLVALCATGLALAPASGAHAHPLGNFTVNHYDGLRLHPDRIELLAVVDYAEIPTLQAGMGRDGGTEVGSVAGVGSAASAVPPDEARQRAGAECSEVARSSVATVDGVAVSWTVLRADRTMPAGEAGLPTTRVECELRAPAALDRPAAVGFVDGHLADRIGWREITAVGQGVDLVGSPVPAVSVSEQLRAYPRDLLADPLDERSVVLQVRPGSGSGSTGPDRPAGSAVDRLQGELGAWFAGLVGTADLTGGVGLLAVLLALVLGAGHALLPGHGKTVVAAYLAGRRGTRRDALLVGATVTATHTAGVLVLGLVLSVSATLAPDGVLRWLGALSGLLVAAIGGALLRSAWRARGAAAATGEEQVLVLAGSGGHGHSHGHPHSHGHGHGHGHGHPHGTGSSRLGRGALVGLGVAGGLVPSPTALLVLLGAIGLGRSWFGVGLVLSYGLGMAATLTVAGLLLVGLRDRLDHIRVSERLRHRTAGLVAAVPVLTAVLVLVVGLGLALRSLAGVA